MNFDPTEWVDSIDWDSINKTPEWEREDHVIPINSRSLRIPSPLNLKKGVPPPTPCSSPATPPSGPFDKPCYYGTGCRNIAMCQRSHLALADTPCMYGPNCKSVGCKRLHTTKIFKECVGACDLLDCAFIHKRDLCRFGKGCTNQGCKFIHPDVFTLS